MSTARRRLSNGLPIRPDRHCLILTACRPRRPRTTTIWPCASGTATTTPSATSTDGSPVPSEVGGEPALAEVVRLFHNRLKADPTVRHFFPSEGEAQLIARQRVYFAAMLGGPSEDVGAERVVNVASRLWWARRW